MGGKIPLITLNCYIWIEINDTNIPILCEAKIFFDLNAGQGVHLRNVIHCEVHAWDFIILLGGRSQVVISHWSGNESPFWLPSWWTHLAPPLRAPPGSPLPAPKLNSQTKTLSEARSLLRPANVMAARSLLRHVNVMAARSLHRPVNVMAARSLLRP